MEESREGSSVEEKEKKIIRRDGRRGEERKRRMRSSGMKERRKCSGEGEWIYEWGKDVKKQLN